MKQVWLLLFLRLAGSLGREAGRLLSKRQLDFEGGGGGVNSYVNGEDGEVEAGEGGNTGELSSQQQSGEFWRLVSQSGALLLDIPICNFFSSDRASISVSKVSITCRVKRFCPAA